MKKMLVLLLAVALILTFTACSSSTAGTAGTVLAAQLANEPAVESVTIVNTALDSGSTSVPVAVEYDDDDLDASVDHSDLSTIRLEGDSIAFEGSGATVEGTTITITSAGTYSVSGTLDDGQIVVETEDEETVVLVLNGADIACSTSAPIYVSNAQKTVITLAEGAGTCRRTHGVGMNRPARSNNEVISKITKQSREISLLYSAPGDRPVSRLIIKRMAQADDHLHVFLM